MRQEIINALIFPRMLVKDHLELDNCDHSGRYDGAATDCQRCGAEPQCQWLYDNDEFEAIQESTTEKLVDALEFALAYVGGEVANLKHSYRRCNCDICIWLRDAHKLFIKINES